MRLRPLGQTGITVSAIGFGAWGIGGHTPGGRSYGPTDDKESLAALAAAFDAGVTFYDTAPLYGLGHSESLIGRAFARRRDQVVIATKAGYADFHSGADFQPATLRASLESSLRRLGTDYVDVLQLHDPDPTQLTAHPEIAETLRDLKAEGKVRVAGASVKSPSDALALLPEDGLFQVIQCNFSMMDLRALECGLMEKALARGVALVARTPLCFGFLSGELDAHSHFDPDDHRSRWPQAQRTAWADGTRRLLAAAGQDDDCVTTALRFVLSFAAVATTIPGMLTPGQVAANCRAGQQPPLDETALRRIVACNQAHDGFKVPS